MRGVLVTPRPKITSFQLNHVNSFLEKKNVTVFLSGSLTKVMEDIRVPVSRSFQNKFSS